MDVLVFLGSQNNMICSKNGLLRAPRRAPEVQKLVSDAYPVNIDQLCGVWNQIWCRTRLPEGLNVPYRGKSDSPEPPWTVLGKLGPGQLGPGQFGPSAQLSGAQFATF